MSTSEERGAFVDGGAPVRPAAKRARPLPRPQRPKLPGLYDPENEHDACGVGFIVNLKKRKSRQIVEDGLAILENLEHRGAVGADPLMGDGAGIMVQIPHRFFAQGSATSSALPCPSRATTPSASSSCRRTRSCAPRWRRRRGCDRGRGPGPARLARRADRQFLACPRSREIAATEPATGRCSSAAAPASPTRTPSSASSTSSARSSRRKIYSAYGGLQNDFYIVSMSCRTIVYKGMFLASQLGAYYADLHDPLFESALRARPPAFLDQHLPVLAAGPSLSDGRPQRRDQHRARQRQLDGGAPGVACAQPCSATTSTSSGRSPSKASRTPPASTTPSSF